MRECKSLESGNGESRAFNNDTCVCGLIFDINNNNGSCDNNRIYNKILDRDWGKGAYLSRNRRVITRVSNYRCPIIGY